jgi:DNA invertase Pin-like site-specific DNA recombinase
MRAAIYSRVSTDKQENEVQLAQLRSLAQTEGHSVVEVFEDVCTGGTSDREAFQRMFQAAERHEFELLIVWAADRISREGGYELETHYRRLKAAGVRVRSLSESHVGEETDESEILTALDGWKAKKEKQRISQRTRAGLALARSRGVKLGRPIRIFDVQKASQMLRDGISKRQVSRSLNIPLSTLLDRVEAI